MNKKKSIVKDQEEENLATARDEQKQKLLLRIKKERITTVTIVGDEQEKKLLLRIKKRVQA
jgi:hypothetical protein